MTKKSIKHTAIILLAFLLLLPLFSLRVSKDARAEESIEGKYCYLYGNAEGSYYKMFQAGNFWRYSDKDEYAVAEKKDTYADMLHPGNFGDVMKGWLSFADGTANISVAVKLENAPSGSDPAENGIRFSLFVRKRNGDSLSKAQPLSETYYDYEVKTAAKVVFDLKNIQIARGDVIIISINNNGNNNSDGNRVDFMVTFNKTADGDSSIVPDFGCAESPVGSYYDVQGVNGWFYAYGTPQKYILMNWGQSPVGYAWMGNHKYQLISADVIHPYGKWSCLKIWIAGFDGEIEIGGSCERNSTEGDGTFVNIYHNGKRLWWEQCDYIGSKIYPIDPITLTVKKGDAVIFEVRAGDRYDERGDALVLESHIYKKRIDSDYDEREDLSTYLSLCRTEAEMVGITNKTDDAEEGCGAAVSVSSVFWVFICITAGLAFVFLRRKEGRL